MRLDKFLKVSRLIKRRSVAQAMTAAGGVMLNDRVAKPASTVRVGDTLVLLFGNRTLTVQVEQVPEKAVPAQMAKSLYTVLADAYNKPSPDQPVFVDDASTDDADDEPDAFQQ